MQEIAAAQLTPDAAAIVTPTSAAAVPSQTMAAQSGGHLSTIAQHGRIAWHRNSSYNRRNWVVTAVYRYEAIIGRRLHARNRRNRRPVAKAACDVLSGMTWLDMPVTVWVV
jgi:hypothetical protein